MTIQLTYILKITVFLLGILQAKYFEFHQFEVIPLDKNPSEKTTISLRIYLDKKMRTTKYRSLKKDFKGTYTIKAGVKMHEDGIIIEKNKLNQHQMGLTKTLLTSLPFALDCFVYTTTSKSTKDPKSLASKTQNSSLPSITQEPASRTLNIETHEKLFALFIEQNEQQYEVYPFDIDQEEFMVFSKEVAEQEFNERSTSKELVKEEVLDQLLLLNDPDSQTPYFKSSVAKLLSFHFEMKVLDEHCPKFSAAQYFFEHRTLMEYKWKSELILEGLESLNLKGNMVSYKSSNTRRVHHAFKQLNEKGKKKVAKIKKSMTSMVSVMFGSPSRVQAAKEVVEKVKLEREKLDLITESINNIIYKEAVNEKMSSYDYIEDVEKEIQEKKEMLAIIEKFGFDVDSNYNERVDGRQSVGLDFWRLENNHKQCYQMKQILTSLPRYKKPHWKLTNLRKRIYRKMTRMHQGRTLQSFRRLGTDLLIKASPNNVEQEARTRMVDRYNQRKKKFFQSFYKDWAAESKSRKEKLKLYEGHLSKANVELQIAARKLNEKNEKILKLLVKTRDFFDPRGGHYRDYSRFYNIVKSLNNILEKAEELTTKREDVSALILAVRRAERLAGKHLEISDNGRSWRKLRKRLCRHMLLIYYMKITKIRERYSWTLERLWIEQKGTVNQELKDPETHKNTKLTKMYKKFKSDLVSNRDTMHEIRKFFEEKLEFLKKDDLRMMKWVKEYMNRIVIAIIHKKETKEGPFKRFKENSRKLHDFQKELIDLQEEYDEYQLKLFTAQSRLQTIKQNIEWEHALAKDTEQLLKEELDLFENLKDNIKHMDVSKKIFIEQRTKEYAEKLNPLKDNFEFFFQKYNTDISDMTQIDPEERLRRRVGTVRKRLKEVKVISQMDSHIDELLARLFVNVQFLENGMQCFSLAELSYIIFKLIKVNAIIDDKAFLTRFTSEMYDREPKRALEFAMFNYSALLGPKFLAKQNTAFFYKMGMPKWNKTIDEKMLTYFVQNYGVLINLHKDLTKFGISTQGQKPKHDDYVRFAKNAFFRLIDTFADAYINYTIASKIEQNFSSKVYEDDVQEKSGISKEIQKDIQLRVNAETKRITDSTKIEPTEKEMAGLYQTAYTSELQKNAKSFTDRWSPKLGLQIWKSRTDLASQLAIGLKLLLFALSCVPNAGIIINVIAKFFLKEYKAEINQFGQKISEKINSLFEKVKKRLKRAMRFRHLRTIDAFGVDIQNQYALIDPADIFFMKDLASLGSKAIADPKVTDDPEQDPDHFEKKMEEAILRTPDFQGMRVFREDFVTMGLIELSNEDFMKELKNVITQNVERESFPKDIEKVLPGPYDTFFDEVQLDDGQRFNVGDISLPSQISFENVLDSTRTSSERHSDPMNSGARSFDHDGVQTNNFATSKNRWNNQSLQIDTESMDHEKTPSKRIIKKNAWMSDSNSFKGDVSEHSDSKLFGKKDKLAELKDKKSIFDLSKDPKVSEIYKENPNKLASNWRPLAVEFLKNMLVKVRKDQIRQIKMDKYNTMEDSSSESDEQDAKEEKSMVSNQLTVNEFKRIVSIRAKMKNFALPLEEEEPVNLMRIKPMGSSGDGIIEAFYFDDSQKDDDLISAGNGILHPRRFNSLNCIEPKEVKHTANNMSKRSVSLPMFSPNNSEKLAIFLESKEKVREEKALDKDSLSSNSEDLTVLQEFSNFDLAQRENFEIVEEGLLKEIRENEALESIMLETKTAKQKDSRRLYDQDFDLNMTEDDDQDLVRVKKGSGFGERRKRILAVI